MSHYHTAFCDCNDEKSEKSVKPFKVVFTCECGCSDFVECSEFYIACAKCGREYMNPIEQKGFGVYENRLGKYKKEKK